MPEEDKNKDPEKKEPEKPVEKKPAEEKKPEAPKAEEKKPEAPKEEAPAKQEPAKEEAPAKEGAKPEGEAAAKKAKKINRLTLKDLEKKIQLVQEKMGSLTSHYAQQLLRRKEQLLEKMKDKSEGTKNP